MLRVRHGAGAVAFAFAAASCAHMVTVYSEPPGAQIFVNGEAIGNAPTTFTERSGFHKKYVVRAELPGYSPWMEEHEQKQPSNLLMPSIVGAYLLLLPIVGVLWGYQLEDNLAIRLEPYSQVDGAGDVAE